MKKIILIFISLLMVSFVFSGCNKSTTTAKTSTVSETITVGKDYTIKLKTRDFSSFGDKLKPTMTVRGSACLLFPCETFEQNEQHASNIIKCTVLDSSFMLHQCTPYTVLTIQVNESLKGNYKLGDKITVIQYGGYMTLQDEVNYSDNAFRFPETTKAEREKTLIEKKMTDEPYPETGDNFIFFLTESNLFKGAYEPVGDNFSRYKLNKNGEYERAVSDDYVNAQEYNKIKFDDSFKLTIKELAEK